MKESTKELQGQVLRVLFTNLIMVLIITCFIPISADAKAVRLNKKSISLCVNESTTLKVIGKSKKVKWSSSNKKVATVSKKGKVKAKKKGNAVITATISKKKLKCKVIVEKSNLKKTGTLVINEVNTSNVQQLHNMMMEETEINLKLLGNREEAYKKCNEICEMLKKINKQGVIFFPVAKKSVGNYYLMQVSTYESVSYKYCVLFIEKLYRLYREKTQGNITKIMEDYPEIALYPDEYTANLRDIYDFCISEFTASYNVYYDTDDNLFHGSYSQPTNISVVGYDSTITDLNTDLGNQDFDYESFITKKIENSDENIIYYLYSFDEFLKIPNLKNIIPYFNTSLGDYPSSQDMIIKNTPNFCDLSDAMKVYAISESSYFLGAMQRIGYGMIYKNVFYFGESCPYAMKDMYNNEAYGVCQVFANYEEYVFKYIDIVCYNVVNDDLFHAYTVVKVQNSIGKVLWIPFDYGIGPVEHLDVSKKVYDAYLSTEADRYRTYLSVVKGAPLYKNFTDSDFS